MPIYDFLCHACGERFDALVAATDQPVCVVCGSADVERLLSPISPPAKFGLRGGDARRSDAKRRAREEQRRARREARREGGG